MILTGHYSEVGEVYTAYELQLTTLELAILVQPRSAKPIQPMILTGHYTEVDEIRTVKNIVLPNNRKIKGALLKAPRNKKVGSNNFC